FIYRRDLDRCGCGSISVQYRCGFGSNGSQPSSECYHPLMFEARFQTYWPMSTLPALSITRISFDSLSMQKKNCSGRPDESGSRSFRKMVFGCHASRRSRNFQNPYDMELRFA